MNNELEFKAEFPKNHFDDPSGHYKNGFDEFIEVNLREDDDWNFWVHGIDATVLISLTNQQLLSLTLALAEKCTTFKKLVVLTTDKIK